MNRILELDLQNVGVTLIFIVAVMTALAQLWTRWVGPFLAKPIGRTIGKAIRAELRELVEEIVTALVSHLLQQIGEQAALNERLERKLRELDNRITEHSRKPHRFVGGP